MMEDGDKQLNIKLEVEENSAASNKMDVSVDKVDDFDHYPSKRKKHFFYDVGADATLHFQNGYSIRVNKGTLAFHSSVFTDLFYGSQPKSDVHINNFNAETFRIFLDCLLGLEDYTPINALLIYPIARQYKVEKSLNDCIYELTPNFSTKMDKNICLTLNLALLYDCKTLTEAVVNFLKNQFGILNLFETDDYYFCLEPASMFTILQCVDMNTFFLEKIYKWAENYLIKNSRSVDNIRSFLDENNIFFQISLITFESVESIFKFHEETSQKKLFSTEEILRYFKNSITQNPCKFPSKSSWVKMNKGDVLQEKICFKCPLSFGKVPAPKENCLKIYRNCIICDDCTKGANENDKKIIIKYEIFYWYYVGDANDNKIKSSPHIFPGYLRPKTVLRLRHNNVKHTHSITAIDAKYTFESDCRILKTSLDVMPLAVDDGQLHFTCDM